MANIGVPLNVVSGDTSKSHQETPEIGSKILKSVGVVTSLLAIATLPASAFEYDFGTRTNLSAWQVSVDNGASFSPSQVYQNSPHELWPKPFGEPGVWLGMFEFFLPENAEDINLSFFGIGANDRVVFSLNDDLIAGSDHVIFGSTGMGIHDFGDGNGAVPFNFASTNWQSEDPDPLVVTEGFILGGMNRLIAHMNNTGVSNPAAPATNTGLETAMYVDGKVTYSVTPDETKVPEPGLALSLGLFGLASSRKKCVNKD
jgi:hypothetical protein